MTYDIKQVIVVRKDLNMRKGKIAAQVAHGSLKIFFDLGTIKDGKMEIRFPENNIDEFTKWCSSGFAKIVVSVDSLNELLQIQSKAIAAGLPNALIVDSGATEFHNVPTETVIAIGPAKSEEIDLITGGLKLL